MKVTDRKTLLEKWLLHATRKAYAHASCAQRSRTWRRIIGVPSVLLSAIVGTAVFAELENSEVIGRFTVIVMVLCSAALTSLQTFFNYGEVEQVHKAADKKYSQVRRKLDRNLADVNKVTEDGLKLIEQMLNEASEIEPSIPDKVWEKMERKIT